MLAKRQLFRTQALEHYARNRQRDVLPMFITPPTFLFLWCFLLITGSATFFAWQEHVPVYAQVLGIILVPAKGSPTALLFAPPGSTSDITVGQTLPFQVSATGQQLRGSVTSIDARSTSPEEARARYTLTGDAQWLITRPATVVHLTLTPQGAAQFVDHLSISAQVQVGSRSLLTMLPDLLGNAFGG